MKALPRTARAARVACAALPLALLLSSAAAQPVSSPQSLPARLSDSTFWALSNELSEPGGYFRSDNLVSNETSFQWVVPGLQKLTHPNAVYFGVALEQNFTFIAALKPKVAFIVDIRRGNLLGHLMYKAIFETSPNRAEFMSKLFGRPRPQVLSASSTVEDLFTSYGTAPRDSAFAARTFTAIIDRLTKTHGFALSPDDVANLQYIHNTFTQAGVHLTYSFSSGGSGFGGRGMPTYAMLMLESDSSGTHRSFLASEENFRLIKDMQERNVIVPLTGDFAGPTALRAMGKYVRERGATVTAFYTSNVEQYLFQDAKANAFFANVATLPLEPTSVFIRSSSQGMWLRQQSPNGRQAELLCPISEQLKMFLERRDMQYYYVFEACR
jgi:hypothetical protein